MELSMKEEVFQFTVWEVNFDSVYGRQFIALLRTTYGCFLRENAINKQI